MDKVEVEPFKFLSATLERMNSYGLLLVSAEEDGRPNVMTIGWGLIGTMWREPFFVVAVRVSRYTHKLLEERGEFTVNVPGEGMEEVLRFCGTVSGRGHDKFAEMGLKPIPGRVLRVPSIAGCPAPYECTTAFKVDVEPGALERGLEEVIYPHGDYHTLYYGRILGAYSEKAENKPFPQSF